MNAAGFRLGKVFGIELTVDYSWLFIFALVTWNLTALFGSWHAGDEGWHPMMSLLVAAVASILFFVSVLVHELAHSLVAMAHGLKVRSIRLFLFGGVSNIEREPERPGAEFLTAVVGPIASALIGVGAIFLATILVGLRAQNVEEAGSSFAHLGPGATLLMWLGPVNIGVAIFNLIPGFPLDGGRILRSILWKTTGDVRKATRWAAAVGQGIGWMFIVAGIATVLGMRVPFLGGGGLMGGLWIAFIGWFLTRAAAQSVQAMELKDMFTGVPVARAMRTATPVVSSDASVGAVIDLWFTRTDEMAIPVDEHGRFVGLLTLDAVKAVPREQWETTTVRNVMRTGVPTVSPTDDLAAAITKLGEAPFGVLPVVEDEALVGLLEQRDIARWLDLYGGRPSRPWTEATRRR